MSALGQKQTKCIAATATSFNHIICSDEHCFQHPPVRTAVTPPSQRARPAGQVSALHSPVLVASSASIIWTHAYHSRANSSADWSLGQCFDMILAGLRTVHDNCKLLEAGRKYPCFVNSWLAR